MSIIDLGDLPVTYVPVGYVYDGEFYCPGCLPPVEGCECPADQLDARGKCSNECSGLGPSPILRGHPMVESGKAACWSCKTPLKEVT